MQSLIDPVLPGPDAGRAQELFTAHHQANARRTDRMFAVLMILQWAAAIIVALVLSPRSWTGAESQIHPHVWLALFAGAALASLPVYLACKLPGAVLTRHVIGLAQMLFSSLLIHVSGGRIETHFHVFGSLAFLAFYRDWKVLLPATVLVAADHLVRGTFWPESVFGITTAEPWRWVEHAGWVIYEDIFLLMACRYGVQEMWANALRMAELERMNGEIQQQSAELEAAYRSQNAIVETALDAVISIDSRGKITGWNSQAEATFGYRAAEALGRSLAETIIPTRDRERHCQGLERYLATGESRVLNQRIEVSALHRSGREFPVEISISPIRAGDAVSFCAFIRDITVRLQVAEALRSAKDDAEAANHAKSAFLANMSHEIRTPLNGILGFTDVMLEQIDSDPAERRDYLQTIHQSGRHLLTLINDVLDLSKIESGQMEMERIRCSPHEIIAATISILRVRAQERGLSLEYFWKGEIPESIISDPARLRQILMNLVGNAIKFTEVGSVQVVARLQFDTESRLVVDVIDTGVGIDPAGAERIFDPFVQADNSITRRFGGTGLGLSISRRLARLLDGDLTVNSELGRGSIFSVSIPTGPLEAVRMSRGAAADVLLGQRAVIETSRTALPPCRILLVDDGVTNRKLMSLVLTKAGAQVVCAENGQAAVDAVHREAFDLVLMDMQMPVMDGYTATRELRRRGCETPIVALTAHAMSGDERKCREAGCSGYWTKPIDPPRLLAGVAAVLAESSAESAASIASTVVDTRPPAAVLVSTLPSDDPEFQEIVADFVVQLEERLLNLRQAHASGDSVLIARIAHWLKGSAGTMGFDPFTRPAIELHELASAGSIAAVAEKIQEIDALFRRISLPARC